MQRKKTFETEKKKREKKHLKSQPIMLRVAHINARAQRGFSLDNRDTRTTHDDDDNADANNGKW